MQKNTPSTKQTQTQTQTQAQTHKTTQTLTQTNICYWAHEQTNIHRYIKRDQ